MAKVLDINWSELGFDYIKTDYRYISVWKDGSWDD
ncbi:MAG: branched chain amino acid aminotransferase, partial [Candidatus Saccharibacteria bacterium]